MKPYFDIMLPIFTFSIQMIMRRLCTLLDSIVVPNSINFKQKCCFHFSSSIIVCLLFFNAFKYVRQQGTKTAA